MSTFELPAELEDFSIYSVYAEPNPDWGTPHDAWAVTLTNPRGETLETAFHKGFGHHGESPRLEEVLSSLMDDAHSYDEARSFEEWAADVGEDADSRSAERLYNACGEISEKLHAFLDADEWDALFEMER